MLYQSYLSKYKFMTATGIGYVMLHYSLPRINRLHHKPGSILASEVWTGHKFRIKYIFTCLQFGFRMI